MINVKMYEKKAQHKIDDINTKINDLETLKKSLNKLVTSCINEQTSSFCPIIDNLEN